MSELHEYKCPNCDGKIEFDSSSQNMQCPYCGSEFYVDSLRIHDEQLARGSSVDADWSNVSSGEWQERETDGLRSYVCNSCGGEITADSTTAASKCPFCDNPVVMMDRFSGQLRPDYVIPFKLDIEAAKQGLQKHLSGKKLLPKEFRNQN